MKEIIWNVEPWEQFVIDNLPNHDEKIEETKRHIRMTYGSGVAIYYERWHSEHFNEALQAYEDRVRADERAKYQNTHAKVEF